MANDSEFEDSGIYINYNAFELICYDVGHRRGNMEIEISREEAKAICKAIGLLGFKKSGGDMTACVYEAPIWEKNNTGHLMILEEQDHNNGVPSEEEMNNIIASQGIDMFEVREQLKDEIEDENE